MEARDKLNQIKTELKNNFVERDGLIPVLMGLYLAGENALLFGPPGTAKSALADAICINMGGGNYFRYLLTRFTTPDELFGPRSVQGLKNDSYRRVTKGYAPEASVLFADEIFKANSAVLNTLLTLINEREFFDDGKRVKVPLRMTIGASNELPEGPELAALYDRFVARYWIDYVEDVNSRKQIMLGKANGQPASISLTAAEIDLLTAEAKKIPYADGLDDMILTIEDRLKEINIIIGDRRRRAIYKTLPMLAYVQGDDEVIEDTLAELLPDMLWQKPAQRANIYKSILAIANPTAKKAQEILDAANEVVKALEGLPKNEAYPGQLLNGRKLIEEMIDKLINLDKRGKNKRIKEASKNIGRVYTDVMNKVMEQAGLEAFKGNKVTDALKTYLKKGGENA